MKEDTTFRSQAQSIPMKSIEFTFMAPKAGGQ